jgi:type IV pilus assembly protein PilN
MLVEINLLPQKQQRSMLIFIIAGLVFSLFMTAIIVGYFSYESKSRALEAIENEIEFTIALREIEEQKLVTGEKLGSFAEIMAKIDWISSQRISLVFLLDHLVSLLPERGYFMNYQYSDQGTVSINVQFDTPREAASYLNELNESPYIIETALQNLTTQEVTDEVSDERFHFLPRYMANYSITIDREAVKRAEEKEE